MDNNDNQAPAEAVDNQESNAPVDAPINDSATESATPPVAKTAINDEKPKKKGNKGLLIALIVFFILAAGATAVILLWPTITGGNKGGQSSSQQQGGDTPETISKFRIKDNSVSDFDFQVLKQNNDGKNKVYSPLSIKYVLQMLSDASDGETKKQIDAVLGDYKTKSYIDSKNRSLVNALFVRNDFKQNILESYISGLKKNYNADVVFDDFSNAKTINKWISDKTLNIINGALDDKEIENIDFTLVNALAIDMQWTNRIQRTAHYDDRDISYDPIMYHEKYEYEPIGPITEGNPTKFDFNSHKDTEGGQIGATINNYDILKEVGEDKIRSTVKEEYEKWLKTGPVDDRCIDTELDSSKYVDSYIKQIGENYGKAFNSTSFSMLDNDNVRVFAKDLKEYDGATLQYVGIMPKTQKLNDYIKDLKAEDISNIISNLKSTDSKVGFKEGVVTRVNGYVPFFKYDYSLELTKNLTDLGIKDVFDSNADLSKMTSVENEHVAYVKHAANIDFSNDGIKAAAVTTSGGEGDSGCGFHYNWDVPIEDVDMTFDKPFIYIIRDKDSGEIWFAGSVYEINK